MLERRGPFGRILSKTPDNGERGLLSESRLYTEIVLSYPMPETYLSYSRSRVDSWVRRKFAIPKRGDVTKTTIIECLPALFEEDVSFANSQNSLELNVEGEAVTVQVDDSPSVVVMGVQVSKRYEFHISGPSTGFSRVCALLETTFK